MQLLRKLWVNFLAQPDIWFFYAFLITFTLTIRKVLYFFPINNQFNEYSGIYLYLSDIFLILTATSWIINILYNRKSYLSNKSSSYVPRGTIYLLITFLLLSVISITWSSNIYLAIFKFLKITELLFLAIYISKEIVPRGTIFKNSLRIIIISATFQSIIGIWQFIIQHSVGFFWLKESLIGANIPGVAKIIFDGEKVIRSYGLFPHPNIFGGFLFFSIILTYLYYKLFHVEQFPEKNAINCSTWNNNICEVYNPKKDTPPASTFREYSSIQGGHGTITIKIRPIITLLISIQIVALFLTFSKSAIIGLFITTSYILITLNVPRGTNFGSLYKSLKIKFINVPRGTLIIKRILLLISITLTLLLITKPDIYSLFFKSLGERMLYINVSRGTIIDNLFFGSGIGQFVINMQSYTNLQLSNWQFQPVHNVFLLIWSELGLTGLLLFFLIFWKLFHVEQFPEKNSINCSTWNNNICEVYNPKKNVPPASTFREYSSIQGGRGTIQHNTLISIFSRGLLLGIIFIMIFDHYFWTIQQGQIILWMTIALLYQNENS